MGGDNGAAWTAEAREDTSPLGLALANIATAVSDHVREQERQWEAARDLALNGQEQGDGVHAGRDSGQWLDIVPEAAVPIPPVDGPRRIACVDGGNAVLVGSPGWSVGFNRVHYSMCRGREVLPHRYGSPIDFFSLLLARPGGGDVDGAASSSCAAEGAIDRPRQYTLRTFPIRLPDRDRPSTPDAAVDNNDNVHSHRHTWPPPIGDCVPTAEEMDAGDSDSDSDDGAGHDNGGHDRPAATDHNRSRMMSVPRSAAEWKLAARVAELELDQGDILIMDGTLQTGYAGEAALAERLYETCRKKGITVCALAKTTTLMTAGGMPLLYAATEAARRSKAAKDRAWYMPLARRVSGDDRGFMLAVRLHPRSMFTFRFEILHDQYEEMTEEEIGHVIGSVAANSGDISFLGYPYGLICADRYARIRTREAAYQRRRFTSMFGLYGGGVGQAMHEQSRILSAHKMLNRAVGGG